MNLHLQEEQNNPTLKYSLSYLSLYLAFTHFINRLSLEMIEGREKGCS